LIRGASLIFVSDREVKPLLSQKVSAFAVTFYVNAKDVTDGILVAVEGGAGCLHTALMPVSTHSSLIPAGGMCLARQMVLSSRTYSLNSSDIFIRRLLFLLAKIMYRCSGS
jgi:hypothetical protein